MSRRRWPWAVPCPPDVLPARPLGSSSLAACARRCLGAVPSPRAPRGRRSGFREEKNKAVGQTGQTGDGGLGRAQQRTRHVVSRRQIAQVRLTHAAILLLSRQGAYARSQSHSSSAATSPAAAAVFILKVIIVAVLWRTCLAHRARYGFLPRWGYPVHLSNLHTQAHARGICVRQDKSTPIPSHLHAWICMRTDILTPGV
jgi:hypothetical protein